MQMLKRAGNDFKAAIWTMLKGVKEHDEIMMERQPQQINKSYRKKNQREIL